MTPGHSANDDRAAEAALGVGARRLMLVHAHPDDETITTGGTIARYLEQGVEVMVVTCTLGEEGEVIGDRWAHLVADEADQLGGYRIGELGAALARLGGPRHCFLGGAGRWRDSGMAGTPAARNPRAFVNAGEAPVDELVSLIRRMRPQVVVAYDTAGSYGHPDHIQVNQLTTRAVERAAGHDAAAGDPWRVAKFYWTVTERSALAHGLAALEPLPDGWRMPRPGELAEHPDEEITTEIDVRSVLQRKRDALAAHATQVTVAPEGSAFALSNNIAQPVLDREHFMLISGDVQVSGTGGREDDLFTGVV